MPFTAAHPAAVLPLKRLCPRYFSWSALIIGALTPDLEYFLTLRPRATLELNILGTLYFCLPAGILLFILFHVVVKRPAVLLLPGPHRDRLWQVANPRLSVDARRLVAILGSILIGSWTHLLWDSFTHAGRWGVNYLPVLSTEIASVSGYTITVFKILQHGSTLLGIGCLAAAYLRWFSSARARIAPRIVSPWRIGLGLSIAIVPLVLAMVLGIQEAQDAHGLVLLQRFVGKFAIVVVSAGGLILVVSSVLVTIWKDQLTTGWRERCLTKCCN